jgi:hypothetical protein
LKLICESELKVEQTNNGSTMLRRGKGGYRARSPGCNNYRSHPQDDCGAEKSEIAETAIINLDFQ